MYNLLELKKLKVPDVTIGCNKGCLATSFITEILFPQMSTLADVIVLVVQLTLGRPALFIDGSVCKLRKQIQGEKLSHISRNSKLPFFYPFALSLDYFFYNAEHDAFCTGGN